LIRLPSEVRPSRGTETFFSGGNMVNLEPVALSDSSEWCAGFFVLAGKKVSRREK